VITGCALKMHVARPNRPLFCTEVLGLVNEVIDIIILMLYSVTIEIYNDFLERLLSCKL
jgi:hypothetical protein